MSRKGSDFLTGSNRTKANGFKHKEGKLRLHARKNFFYLEGSDILEQVAQEAVDVVSL